MGSKKKILLGLGGLGLLGILGGLGILAVKNRQAPVAPLPLVSPVPAAEEKLATYNDEAGFSFEHSEGLIIEDVSKENDYSVLRITSPPQAGEMTIKVVDTTEKELKPTGESRDVTLAGLPAKQFQLENPRRLVTAAIDEGVLFYLESSLETAGTYWNKVHNDIVSSFELTGEQKTSTDTIYEEEEVVE